MVPNLEFREALVVYGRTIKADGWAAGEPLIERGVRMWGQVFKQWAHALGIMLRAEELLEEK